MREGSRGRNLSGEEVNFEQEAEVGRFHKGCVCFVSILLPQLKVDNLHRLSVPTNLDQASISDLTTGPVYSKEYLSELKASTQTTPAKSTAAAATTYDSDLSFDASELAGAVVVDIPMDTGWSAAGAYSF